MPLYDDFDEYRVWWLASPSSEIFYYAIASLPEAIFVLKLLREYAGYMDEASGEGVQISL